MPLTKFPNSPAPAQDFTQLPPNFPEVPDAIQERFPDAQTWNSDILRWYKQLAGSIGDATDSVTSVVNANDQVLGDTVIRQGELSVEIATETTARITADELIAQRIVTVSALAGSASHISVQGTPPVGPALNDLWVNNVNPFTPITYQWDGANWVEVTQPISVAAVAAEQTARITADGFLAGKYTITVIAGNVVTGMNITSATGPGTNISSVVFRATDFQIYNGVSGIVMFSVSGANVNLAGVLTVSTSGKVFTGTGNYGNVDTPFYVDNSSNFSLGSKLTWDGATLTVSGNITATTGMIGGFTIGATTLSATNIMFDSSAPSMSIGNLAAEHITLEIVTGRARLAAYNSANLLTASMQGNDGTFNSGYVQVMDSASNPTILMVGQSGLTSGTLFRAGNGSAGAPSFSFTSDTDTGWYWSASGTMNATTNGTARLTVRDAAVVLLVPLKFDTAQQTITTETLQKFITAQDNSGTTIKLGIVA